MHEETLALCSNYPRAGTFCWLPKAASLWAKGEEQDLVSGQGVSRRHGVEVETYRQAPALLGHREGRMGTPPDVLDRDAVCLGQRVVLVLFCWSFLTPETSIGKTDSALMIQLPELSAFQCQH